MRHLLILFALVLAACGGQTTDNEPPPPPRGPCAASHDLVNGRCVVREIYFAGGTFTMGRGFCPHANLLDQPPGWECPLADRPHTVTVQPFYVDAAPAVHSDHKDNTCAPDAVCEPLLTGADMFVRDPHFDNGQSTIDRYCAKFGKRVLTEAEWEYIATGGGKRLYPWGDQPPSCARANIDPDHCKLRWPMPGRPEIAQVASYAPTPEGVYDMAGNVPEAVASSPGAYADGYTALPIRLPMCPGKDPYTCCSDVWCGGAPVTPVRGGGARGQRGHLRSAYRSVAFTEGFGNPVRDPVGDGYSLVFRCARDAH